MIFLSSITYKTHHSTCKSDGKVCKACTFINFPFTYLGELFTVPKFWRSKTSKISKFMISHYKNPSEISNYWLFVRNGHPRWKLWHFRVLGSLWFWGLENFQKIHFHVFIMKPSPSPFRWLWFCRKWVVWDWDIVIFVKGGFTLI